MHHANAPKQQLCRQAKFKPPPSVHQLRTNWMEIERSKTKALNCTPLPGACDFGARRIIARSAMMRLYRSVFFFLDAHNVNIAHGIDLTRNKKRTQKTVMGIATTNVAEISDKLSWEEGASRDTQTSWTTFTEFGCMKPRKLSVSMFPDLLCSRHVRQCLRVFP